MVTLRAWQCVAASVRLATRVTFAIITQSLNIIQIPLETQAFANSSVAARSPVAKSLWALVPVKALTMAKQRLQQYFGPKREDFAFAMLKDVLDALVASKAVSGIAIVTADPRVAELALQRGLLLVQEHGNCDMNAAIALGVEAIRQNGGRRLVIIHSDIPLVTGTELDRLAGIFLARAVSCAGEMIGISPSADRGGTNCLFLDAGQPFEFCYGPDSFALHCASAGSRHADVVLLESLTVGMDVDEPGDLGILLEYYRHNEEFQHTATWKFLCDRDCNMPAAEASEV
ncbi:MAG: 2-phospho-L-lactate guanylyltransferase [Xanthomonadales bacterium]|nr:2-phospho-L-lactate guanylyltransferase [Xanthomonadales bacterium]